MIPSSGNLYNYAPVNHFMRPDERWTSIGGMVDYAISDTTTVYGELMFNSDATRGQIVESGTFFAEEYLLPVDNAYFLKPSRILLQRCFQ